MSLRLSARSKAAYLGEERFTMSPLDKTILVVEDNDASMMLSHDVLEAHGYNVLQATDGTEGWRMAREHRPDLILMDIQAYHSRDRSRVRPSWMPERSLVCPL